MNKYLSTPYFYVFVASFLLSPFLSASTGRRAVSVEHLPKYRLSHEFGTTWLHGSGVAVGAQLGRRFSSTPLYFGPDLTFVFFSPGSVFYTLGSVWYEWVLNSLSGVTFQPGVSAGVGFSRQLSNVASTLSAVLADFVICKEVDDLASFRLQFRPGLLGRDPVFFVNLNLAFRFH